MPMLPTPPSAPPAPPAPKTVQGGAGAATDEMRADWHAYFSSTAPGTVIAWAGGSLTMLPGEKFAFYLPDVTDATDWYVMDRESIDNPETLQIIVAKYPGIAAAWEQYGILADTDIKASYDRERIQRAQSAIARAAEVIQGSTSA